MASMKKKSEKLSVRGRVALGKLRWGGMLFFSPRLEIEPRALHLNPGAQPPWFVPSVIIFLCSHQFCKVNESQSWKNEHGKIETKRQPD